MRRYWVTIVSLALAVLAAAGWARSARQHAADQAIIAMLVAEGDRLTAERTRLRDSLAVRRDSAQRWAAPAARARHAVPRLAPPPGITLTPSDCSARLTLAVAYVDTLAAAYHAERAAREAADSVLVTTDQLLTVTEQQRDHWKSQAQCRLALGISCPPRWALVFFGVALGLIL